MKSLIIWYLFITVAELTGYEVKIQRNDNFNEEYILRKGGISRRTKNNYGLDILRRLYIAPDMVNRTKIYSSLDLLSYTICENRIRKPFENTSSLYFNFILCPDKSYEYYPYNSMKDYCCFDFTTYCCNFTEFMNRIPRKRKTSFIFSSIYSLIGFVVFVIVISIIIKVLCGSRLRHSYQNMVIFTRRGGPINSQQPLVYPPDPQKAPQYFNNVPMQPFLQYPNSQSTGPVMYAPPLGTGQCSYASPLLPGQYPMGTNTSVYPPGQFPPQVPVQYPKGLPQPYGQPPYQAPSQNVTQGLQPPPEYEKAILQ